MKYFVVIILLLLGSHTANAQQSMEQLLQEVRESRQQIGAEYRQRIAEFSADPAAQKGLLSAARAELLTARKRAEQLAVQLETMAGGASDANAFAAGELTDLFAIYRQHAVAMATTLKNSLVSAQFPGRAERLLQLAANDLIPAPEQLHEFHLLLLEEMVQAGQVSRFAAELVDAAGVASKQQIVRVGLFNLVSANSFLRYEVDTGTIQTLARQPASRFRNDAQTLFAATNTIVPMPIDPTAGQLLGLLIQTPNLTDRIRQGGFVAYTILFLGVAGLLIAIYRLLYLAVIGARINRQLTQPAAPSADNALGRILATYAENRRSGTETLELRLDEAIIRETPRLEKWHVALKVIAAIAPLLGLLGTVIGMIETFQQITLYGTSDPRLMADGISKALVTTMLGLLVAIPIVLLHSIVVGRSRRLIEILEEQSAGLIAEQSENKQ